MIGVAMFTTIKTLWEKHRNKSVIAKLTGHDWKTVSKIVKLIESGGKFLEKKPHPCILDPYKERIVEWLEKEGLNGLKTFERLRSEGVKIGYTTVKTYLADIKKRDEIFVRIQTLPGEEAQVDFGYVGLTLDNNGKKRKTWVFNMRLSYSRLDYYEKAYDQRVETFIQCHINAFAYFGGVPGTVRVDNLKAAILEANFYEPVYQRLYSSLADH
jgi:transposase